MKFRIPFFAFATAVAGLHGQDERTTWRHDAKRAGLNEQAIEHLAKEKVLMTSDEFLQCFQAYLPSHDREGTADGSDLPYFITTDTLFHAYSGCLQKAMLQMELVHAFQMQRFLERLGTDLAQADVGIEGGGGMLQQSKERAKFVVGVAADLMGINLALKPTELAADVASEAKRIRDAVGSGMPARLNLPPERFRDFDYTIFRPTGIYSGDADLEAYFRAVRWLQLVPFRAESELDMLAAAMLARTKTETGDKNAAEIYSAFDRRDRRLCALAGPPDTPSIWSCSASLPSVDGRISKVPATELIRAAREHFEREGASATSPGITSVIDQGQRVEIHATLASASRLVDAVLIEQLSREQGETYFPNALSIAAWLGSRYASALENEGDGVKRIRDEAGSLLSGTNPERDLHTQTMALLQKLVRTPAPDAPAFMKTRAWQAKSCQTALGAWAQARHVMSLQAKPQYAVGAGFEEWPAYIEPSPWFFIGLAELCASAERVFKDAESETERSWRIARQLRQMADTFCRAAVMEEKPPVAENSTSDPFGRIPTYSLDEVDLPIAELLIGTEAPNSREFEWSPSVRASSSKLLRESADLIEQGKADKRHPYAKKLREHLVARDPLAFDELGAKCSRLASLAQQQLKGQAPTGDDPEWLIHFGAWLAFFTDSHFTDPRDTVPKAVRVFTNTTLQKALHAGIGRPRFLYVLYPWNGEEILCRGAVLPYFERHEMKSFTDQEWRDALHDPKSPAIQPDWLAPLIVK